jgi:hypothetical protein
MVDGGWWMVDGGLVDGWAWALGWQHVKTLNQWIWLTGR